jgi:hypothetical protein
MRLSKKIWAILTIILVASLLLVQTPPVYADKETVQKTVINALRDVAGIDVDKYTVNVDYYGSAPTPGYEEKYRGEEGIQLTFKSNKSQFHIIAEYLNNHLTYLYLYIDTGSSSDIYHVNKLSEDPLIATQQVLSRLKEFTGNSVIADMQKIVDPAKDIVAIADKTVGNIKCIVYRDTSMYYPGDERCPVSGVYFMYSYNGAESPKSIGVHFEADGFFAGFHDAWNLYSVGSEEVNVSREQAIAIAREQAIEAAESVTLEFPSDIPVVAELRMANRDNSMLLYPYWFVELPLVYPADLSFYAWQLSIWADTGKIAYSHPVGGYGVILDDINDTTNSSTASSSQNRDALLIAGIIATIAIASLTTAAVVLKKR